MAIEYIPENDIIATIADLETLHTLEITFPDGIIKRWAGREIEIKGARYEGLLIGVSGARRAGGVIDRIDCEIANLDWSHSLRILHDQERIYSKAIVGKLFRDFRSDGLWIWQVLLRGVVGLPYTGRKSATYSVMSDLTVAPQVGATRIASKTCQWKYKDEHCAAQSNLATCNKTFGAAGGCIDHGTERGNQWRFGGAIYDIAIATLTIPAPEPGGSGSGDQGGGGFTGFNPDFLA